MSLQAPPTAAHSQSYADFSFDSPQHTCDKVTDALGRRYDAYLGGPPIQAGTPNVCWACFCRQNAFLSTYSRHPIPIFVRNRTERASGLCFLWKLAELFCVPT